MVEYEEYGLCIPCNKQGVRHCAHPEECSSAQILTKLKIAPDNTITIRSVKDSWNSEEVTTLIRRAFVEVEGKYIIDTPLKINKWIEENL